MPRGSCTMIGCNEAQDAVGRRLHFGLSYDVWCGDTSPFSPSRLAALRRSRPLIAYFHSLPETVPWPEWRGVLCPVSYQSPPHGSLRLHELEQGQLPNGWSSVVGAIAAAFWLGATRIGVLGMDLVDRQHDLFPHRAELGEILASHAQIYETVDVQVSNLSPVSQIHGLPPLRLDEFLAR